MISSKNISIRTSNLAKSIAEDYKNKRPLFLCVLKGASTFLHNLLFELQKLRFGFTYDFIRVKSYIGSESGNVKIFYESDLSSLIQ